jgi:putative transposase
MNIQVNTLIEWHTEEGISPIERVLWIDDSNTHTWTIDIDNRMAWPVFRSIQDISNALATGKARIIPKVTKFLVLLDPDDDYLRKHGERGNINYSLIAPLVEGSNPRIFNRRDRGRLVAKLAERTGRRKAQINLILRRFWQGGCVPNATLPNYFKCGQGTGRQDHGNKLGRPSNETRHTGEVTGRNITKDDRERFRRGIRDYVKGGKVITLEGAWQQTLEKYFNLGYLEQRDGTKVPILPTEAQRPTFASFKAFYYRERDPKTEIIEISGEAEYESNVRPTLGDATHKAFGPGSVYEIDATVGDIYLLSYLDRKLIIGRPVIYIVVDVFSRLIVGFAVTLEGPSWAGAKLALENAFSDKASFCKQFGINITEAEWPACGLPEGIVGDNGEIAGYNANALVEHFWVRIANPPSRRPDLKPVVEAGFNLVKKTSVVWVPGAVRPFKKRRGKDYVLDATLDLNQFRRKMIEYILFHNNCRRMETYRMSKYQIADRVEPVPLKIWNWGMQKLSGKLRPVDEPDLIRVHLLPRAEATLTPQGIAFRGLHYTCDIAIRDQWFVRLKGRKSKRVVILYESLVDRVYLRLGKGKNLVTCALTEADKRFEGSDWCDVLEYLELKKRRAKAAEVSQQQAAAVYHAKANRIIAEAKEMNKAARAGDDRSDTARKKGIRENRRAVKMHERKQGVLRPATRGSSEPASVIPIKQPDKSTAGEGYISPARPYREIRKVRQEAKKHGK